jgi:hypothetical protein
MRKLGILSMIAYLLISCSIPGINTAPTNPPPQETSAVAGTPTRTATITPTQPTPTYTSTPTLAGITPTRTLFGTRATLTGTFTPLPLFIDTATPLILFTADTPGEGFKWVEIEGNEIFWGICKPGVVRIIAEVAEPDEVYNVVIFVRLMDGESTDTTPWSKGAAMNNRRDGTFTYYLNADTISEKSAYRRAWVFFQLVATDLPGNIIGRTKVYTNALTLRPCP